jgi:hypothetical protein
MIVFSYGIPKSGSTLAFKIATCVATLGGHRQILMPGTLLPATLRKGIRDKINFADELDPQMLPRLIEWVGERVIIIKTHSNPSPDWMNTYNKFATYNLVKAHVNHRDPRDICLSLLDAGTRARNLGDLPFSEYADINETIISVKRYIDKLKNWDLLKNKIDIRYESCAFDINTSINQIKDDLKINCMNFLVRTYINNFAFTQKNKGIPKRFLNEMDDNSIKYLNDIFSSYLDRMSYPVA